MLALAGSPGTDSFELTALVVFVCTPTAMPVTLTENEHDTPGGRVAADRLMLFDPAAAVITPPPHEPYNPLGVDTTRPEGRVSINASPVSVVTVFGFATVKLIGVLLLGPDT